MYNDPIFNLVGETYWGWLGIGSLLAVIDYVFNTVMCWLIGGKSQFVIINRRLAKRQFPVHPILRLRLALRYFVRGGRSLWNVFRSDHLSWIWPIFVLGLSTTMYGIVRSAVFFTVLELDQAGIAVENYRASPFLLNGKTLSPTIGVLSIVLSFNTFLRYYRRPTQTFFSKSILFNLLRTVLFNFPLTYMILNIVLVLIDFGWAFYQALSDELLRYPIFHPDQMYGLKPGYDFTITISFVIFIISFLPTLMLLRERDQRYSWIYVALFYGGIVVAMIMLSLFIYRFDSRLESIQQNGIEQIVRNANLDSYRFNKPDVSNGLLYFLAIKSLTGGFPIPFWFDTAVVGRAIFALIFDLRLMSPKKPQPEGHSLNLFSLLMELRSK